MNCSFSIKPLLHSVDDTMPQQSVRTGRRSRQERSPLASLVQHAAGSTHCLTRSAGIVSFLFAVSLFWTTSAFSPTALPLQHSMRNVYSGMPGRSTDPTATVRFPRRRSCSSSSALAVTWFGGTADGEVANGSSDSCELVAVRIERTSANSRRILGEIAVQDCPLDVVWSVLTDYDRLSIHVPNLVESRTVSVQTPQQRPGDGSYRCRLFQKGAQKIVGFEFGASVTMDMVEKILPSRPFPFTLSPTNEESGTASSEPQPRPLEARRIGFKCYDSFFFSEFDGEWKAVEEVDSVTGNVQTVLSYVVDVRPKGPVPVAALEWRIREDVPTNLRAMKSASLKKLQRNKGTVAPIAASESLTAYQSVPSNASKRRQRLPMTPRQLQQKETEARKSNVNSTQVKPSSRLPAAAAFRVSVNWDEDETLGAYLR